METLVYLELTVYEDLWAHVISCSICLQIAPEEQAKGTAVSAAILPKEKRGDNDDNEKKNV